MTDPESARIVYARGHFREHVEKIISETVLGDPVSYDIAPVVVPSPDGSGNMVVAYLLVLSCRSPVLRPPRIAVSDVIYDGHPSDEQLAGAVTKAITSLFEVRRQLCSQQLN
jgi:hypothetical protein